MSQGSHLFDGITLSASADFHVHLRAGDLMSAVTPTIRKGGVDTVYVMPNLIPPITTVTQALSYRDELQTIAPDVNFLMSLYLHPSITPNTIREAKAAGIRGVKSYPAGVTTNSASGVVDYEIFYPVFAAMESEGLILNLHGETPPGKDITVLNAEETFLPTLRDLHMKFPKLKIILEHCTTAAAVAAVKECGPNVAGTITAHHLFLIVDDWAGDPFNFCKPVAKIPSDRSTLIRAAVSGDPKFFFGSDSAPHPIAAKIGAGHGTTKCAAGIFTQPYTTQLVLDAFEAAVGGGIIRKDDVDEKAVKGFLGEHGRMFYGVGQSAEKFRIKANGEKIMKALEFGTTGDAVVPFRQQEPAYSLQWI